jgi:hypothetical protein
MRWLPVVVTVVMLAGVGDAAVLCARKSGALKLRETCKAKETVVDPVALGLRGPDGPAGPAGPTGPSGIIVTETDLLGGFDNTFTPVATLALEAGDYLVVGKVWLTDYSNAGFQEYNCHLVAGGDGDDLLDEAAETLGQSPGASINSGTLVVTNTLTLAQTTVVDMRCANNGAQMSGARSVKLMAIRTGGITVQ